MADGEGFEPPEGLPLQRFSRPPHSTALPTIRNYLPSVFQPTVLVLRMISSYWYRTSLTLRSQDAHASTTLCQPSETVFLFWSTAHIVHYFLRIANIKIAPPAKNIISDNSCPIVNPHDVKKPIWASGARNISQIIRNTAYPIPIMPANAPGRFFRLV